MRKREEKRRSEETNIEVLTKSYNVLVPKEKKQLIRALEEEMFELAKNLEFERAAVVRDEIRKIKEMSSTDRGGSLTQKRTKSTGPPET